MDATRFDSRRNVASGRILRWLYSHPRIVSGAVRKWLLPWIKEYDVTYGGLKWRLHPSDNDTDLEIWALGHTNEEAEIDWLQSHFAGRRICFFDIGANSGVYAIRVGQAISPESRIFAVEPNPIMCERLRTNLALNDVGNVQVLECAIAAERGEMRLRFPKPRKFGSASLHPDVGIGESDFKVDVAPLPELVNDHGVERIDLLKIDVEGFEDQVLCPYLDTASDKSLPEVICLEHKYRKRWRTNLLKKAVERGYAVAVENDRNWILELADRRSTPAGSTASADLLP